MKSQHPFWTAAAFARLGMGRWLREPDGETTGIAGLSTDTRTLRAGEAFVALRGPRFDGNEHLAAAAGAGASLLVVDRDDVVLPGGRGGDAGPAVLMVFNAAAVLLELAEAWRDELAASGCKVIAVAGSNGKTTTRHLIHCALSSERVGTQSPKSFNNAIGVPLTLLGAEASHDFVVVEIGTNHIGEVAALAEVVRPDAAVITSIGEEHLEHLGDIEGVAREEASLVRHVRAGGPTFVTEAAVEMVLPHIPARLRGGVEAVAGHQATRGLTLPGAWSLQNAALAGRVAQWMGVGAGAAGQALREATLPPGRWEVHRVGGEVGEKVGEKVGEGGVGVMVIDDAYNANPSSMRAALEAFCEEAVEGGRGAGGGRPVAVLGDMLELGERSAGAHAGLGRWVAERYPSLTVVLIGPEMAGPTDEAMRSSGVPPLAVFPEVTPATFAAVADLLQPGDAVLLKGSRGMAVERVLAALKERQR